MITKIKSARTRSFQGSLQGIADGYHAAKRNPLRGKKADTDPEFRTGTIDHAKILCLPDGGRQVNSRLAIAYRPTSPLQKNGQIPPGTTAPALNSS